MPSADSPRFFPPPTSADETGLLAVGGRLTPPWLLDAYRHGIFPWPGDDGQSMWLMWWSPDPRAILELNELHISRRLRRTCDSGRFHITCDNDFAGVIHGCATAQDRSNAVWITDDMRQAYLRMHELGIAHSVETWQDGQLVGGVYGLALGGLFAGESMFHLARDASKVALFHLVQHLKSRGYQLFDIQQLTPHMQSLGAKEITRAEFLTRVTEAVDAPVTFGESLEHNL